MKKTCKISSCLILLPFILGSTVFIIAGKPTEVDWAESPKEQTFIPGMILFANNLDNHQRVTNSQVEVFTPKDKTVFVLPR